jgi:hypothetical protein
MAGMELCLFGFRMSRLIHTNTDAASLSGAIRRSIGMSDGAGVHFGASEPRHDGAAIPEAPPVFTQQ